MMDFIVSHPQLVVIIVIFLVARVVSNAKRRQAKVQAMQQRSGRSTTGTPAEQRPNATVASRAGSTAGTALRDVEMSLLRVMEQADQQYFGKQSEPEQPQQPRQPATIAARRTPAKSAAKNTSARNASAGATQAASSDDSSDAFAFRSLMHRQEKERTDYDTTAVDYDRSSSFEFRPASKEPVSTEYHLNFQGFQAAQGLNTGVRVAAPAETGYSTPAVIQKLLKMGSVEDLRRAVLMREILDRPLALRRHR